MSYTTVVTRGAAAFAHSFGAPKIPQVIDVVRLAQSLAFCLELFVFLVVIFFFFF